MIVHLLSFAFMKIFNTKSIDVQQQWKLAFDFRILREQVWKRKLKFMAVYEYNANSNCSVLEQQVDGKLQDLSDQFANMKTADMLPTTYVR